MRRQWRERASSTGPRWCGQAWGPWMPFESGDFGLLPTGPGLYRIRAIGRRGLVYLGETGRSLRGRLSSLRRGVLGRRMPFSDPHTAGPGLWAYRRERNFRYECSAVAFDGELRQRRGLECYLLWRYRLAHGLSPLCSLGRFHPRYSKSTCREMGRRGRRLGATQCNPAGGASAPPLHGPLAEASPRWMGLHWVGGEVIGAIPRTGLYRILDPRSRRTLYIGQAGNLPARLRTHLMADWDGRTTRIEVAALEDSEPFHCRLEKENDLIGAYYKKHGTVPAYQFRHRSVGNSKKGR